MSPYDKYISHKPIDLAARVALIVESIKLSVERRPNEDVNRANIRHMEEFFSFLGSKFPKDRFHTEVQIIPKKKVRTTDRNFIVTVPGKSSERLVMVAHYDTWALSRDAPGADDNTSGVEVLKQYLLRDLCTGGLPPLTHTYLFSGSEECGNRGLISQFGLIFFLTLISFALSSMNPAYLLFALPFLPLVNYRFGITGTSHFVKNLSDEVKSSIRAALAVDAVGEGRLYILENEMGANFLRALFPYEGSEKLNDLLEEGAHLNHIKYNRFLSGGTTDSVAFLEERRPVSGGKRNKHIPAAAVLTMAPGKCSPFVWGGKLHTARDTPDRVYPNPIAEVLTVLDYAIKVLEGEKRPSRPRDIKEHHYARLYRAGNQLFVAMKDAHEPNRRNVNSIFQAKGEINGPVATVRVGGIAGWGVETRLEREMKDLHPEAEEVRLDVLIVEDDDAKLCFEATKGISRTLWARAIGTLGWFERLLGRYSFMAMFGATFLVGFLVTQIFSWAVDEFPAFGIYVDRYYVWVFLLMLFSQAALLARFFTRELPAWMDNAYRNQNRADNLKSLSRTDDAAGKVATENTF